MELGLLYREPISSSDEQHDFASWADRMDEGCPEILPKTPSQSTMVTRVDSGLPEPSLPNLLFLPCLRRLGVHRFCSLHFKHLLHGYMKLLQRFRLFERKLRAWIE